MDQHTVLKNLRIHGYAGIDDRSKVRHLLNGIKSDKLNAVKAHVYATATMRSDFEACVTLYKDFITQSQADGKPVLNVSETATVPRHAPGKSNDHVQDRYYTSKE